MPSSFNDADSPGISHIVEHQMRNWEIARNQHAKSPIGGDRQVAEFVSISRAVGLPGRNVATLLSEQLGWPMFDREILQSMAGDDDCRQKIYEALDERDLNWVESFLNGMRPGAESGEDYFRQLSHTVLSLARKGHTVILGRAADLILPQGTGLRVRITASREFCVKSYSQAKGLSLEKAAKDVEEIEHERARFVRRHFHIEVNDPSRNDLTFNMERFTAQQVADVILAALRTKGVIS